MSECPPEHPDGSPRFTWKEVNCFTRPQSLMCERLADQHGLLFLFLESFYRIWGLDGYFAAPHKAYFRFAEDVLPRTAGVTFGLERIDRPKAVVGRLIELLNAGPVLVPANLRGSPFAQRRDADTVHYFVVTGIDGSDGCRILDCLHNADQDSVPVYSPSSLPLNQLDMLIQEYWRSYVEGKLPTHHGEEQYWLLQVLPTSALDVDRTSVPERILRIYLQPFESGDTHDRRASFFDTRNLLAMGRSLEITGAVPTPLIRAYLAEANDCNVHLRALTYAARKLQCVEQSSMSLSIEKYVEHSTVLRTKAIVRCLTGATSLPDHWSDVSEKLWAAALSLRTELIAQLGCGNA